MNMKSKKIKNEFQNLLRFSSDEERNEHRSKMIMFSFLDIVEKEMPIRKMSKKDLSEKLNTSASFVTQLFTGTKITNLLTVAKLEDIFDINFQISTVEPKNSKKISKVKKSNNNRAIIAYT